MPQKRLWRLAWRPILWILLSLPAAAQARIRNLRAQADFRSALLTWERQLSGSGGGGIVYFGAEVEAAEERPKFRVKCGFCKKNNSRFSIRF